MVAGASPPSTPPKGEHGNLPVSAARPLRCRAGPQSRSEDRTTPCAPLAKDSIDFETMAAQDPSPGNTTASPLQPVHLDILTLGGNVVVQSVFASSDHVLMVKEAVRTAKGWPIWQQRLTFQGAMLEDKSTLGELSLPMEGATLEIVMRQGPSDEVIALAKEVLQEGEAALSSVTSNDISELKAMRTPPSLCLLVCLAVLQLSAGTVESIDVNKNGSPKNTGWDGCKKMLSSPNFLKQLKQIPSAIDSGTLKEERLRACRRIVQDEHLYPDYVAKASIACCGLLKWVLSISRYYDNVAQITEQAGLGGGVTLSEFTSQSVAR